MVILVGEQHNRLWDLTKSELQKIMPPDSFSVTEKKIDGAFRSGYGTLLYFEDTSVVEGSQRSFPALKAYPSKRWGLGYAKQVRGSTLRRRS